MKRNRVNVLTVVNSASNITTETIDGKLDQYGAGRFIKYFAGELKARRQPGIWVRMEYGEITF